MLWVPLPTLVYITSLHPPSVSVTAKTALRKGVLAIAFRYDTESRVAL